MKTGYNMATLKHSLLDSIKKRISDMAAQTMRQQKIVSIILAVNLGSRKLIIQLFRENGNLPLLKYGKIIR